ncbi:MAG TPA: ABC-F family ATP-binding cassette domain-containing protein [Candidatus Absconditabacterales bacterium]|nr:ABC-F family ATP-binding cassette domain-containing protein [Candidatus Absconditabacterales bacterium]
MSSSSPVILSFDKVSFSYNGDKKVILEEASFSVRQQTKITIMGQNGAGKSTLFKLITKELSPKSGKINIANGTSIAIAKQVIPREMMNLTVREYFETAFSEKDYQLDRKIGKVLDGVNLVAPLDKQLKDFSGGQQARLLLAYALIQEPDILLLDEPTNNLDKDGIGHLIGFLLSYDKTVVVISHDADFLNMFTDGVLYLNVLNRQVEQYRGDYYDVVEQISAQVEKAQQQNARMEKKIEDAKAKINFFSNKGGKMRKLASKMRDEVEEAEENKVVVRRDDKTIGGFDIEFENFVGPLVTINGVSLMTKNHDLKHFPLNLIVKKGEKYILSGPNGIGKSTLLKRLLNAHDKDATIHDGVRIGYYSQDFNALDMNMSVWDALHEVSDEITDQEVYRTASHFLLTSDLLKNSIGSLSEGQKGLLCYARFVIQKPHLLILDEPTNHINFRHLPVIAEALKEYEGAIIMVSHDQTFVDQLGYLETVDLGRLIKDSQG